MFVIEQYETLLKKQDGKCAACGRGETMTRQDGTVYRLAVDHCHETGKIRGLICRACNHAIGQGQDDPQRLRKIAAYLEVADTGLVVYPGSTPIDRAISGMSAEERLKFVRMLQET